jgi:L-2-hydroxyglutarate oxidase LhgO
MVRKEVPMDYLHTCVIGAGVVGLAIARELTRFGRDVVVLDRELKYGQGVSSRNSEVIHAGIYYPKDSLKAVLCVRGKHLLYEYCSQHGVEHKRCGKLIVATSSEEEDELAGIVAKAEANGVDDLEYWSADQVSREEPNVSATLALLSPSTGVVSSHDLMTAYLADIEAGGGMFIGGSEVLAVDRHSEGFLVRCLVEGEPYEFACSVLVNSAGLGAQKIAKKIAGLDPGLIPPLYYCKGNYFTMSGKPPFRHLIYPVPEKSGAGLGVHATIDLSGQVKFGPDVEYIDGEDYAVTVSRLGDYYTAVRRYFPDLADDQLSPGYVGIRPKLQGPGDPVKDYMIQDESSHGLRGLVQLFGIESPGLTSSLAIAEHVAQSLQDAY